MPEGRAHELVLGNNALCDRGVPHAHCRREAIAARQGAPKLLLLNGSHDRETGTVASGEGGMSAADVVQAVR